MNHNEITSMARKAGLFVPRAGLPENGALIRFFHAAYAAGMGMTTLREAAQQALEALKMMRDQYEEYACPACDHADAAIYALKEALVEDAMQKFTDVNQELEAALGCDHCNQPLYAAVKCRVCGRVTEPVWVCPDSAEHRYQKPGHCEDCGKTLVQERNFCPRCGKRTNGIHTCTPPGGNDVHG